MTGLDYDYLVARARAERERAHSAASDCARRVHQELARLYTERLQRAAQPVFFDAHSVDGAAATMVR